jgi:hypothetical protein
MVQVSLHHQVLNGEYLAQYVAPFSFSLELAHAEFTSKPFEYHSHLINSLTIGNLS